MPDVHLSLRVLRDYRHGRLDPVEMLAASDHLATCSVCRDALAQLDDGPSYDMLADAVDGKLDPAAHQKLSVQLSDSSAAAAELADLEEFLRQMAPQAGMIYRPTDEAVDARKVIVPSAWAWRSRNTPLVAAAAAVALLVAGWAFWLRQPRPEADRLLTDRDGRPAELSALPPDLRDAVARTLHDERLETVAPVPALHPQGGRLAGSNGDSGNGFQALNPQGVIVREQRPTLHWAPAPTATAYVVMLTSLDGTDVRSSSALPATQTVWTPPEPLASGVIYSWQVEARRGQETLATAPAPPAAEARFQVLSETARAALVSEEQRFGRFPLVMAIAFTRVGLTEAAAEQLNELERQHPNSSVAARFRKNAASPQLLSPINTKGAQ